VQEVYRMQANYTLSNYDNRGRPIMTPPTFIEDEINKLAGQGYVVESFQRESPLSGNGYEGGSFYLSSSSEIVVLLTRAKN